MCTLVDRIKSVRLEYPNRFDSGDDAEEENEKRISQLTLSDCHSNPRTQFPIYKLFRSVGGRSLGQELALLVQGEQQAGYHEVKSDASRLSSGVYFYRLSAGDFVQTRKLLLLR
jgi:hypothetical protein